MILLIDNYDSFSYNLYQLIGAIGYLDFAGNLDTCIGIRLAYKKNGEVCVQSGAGIVADSVPEREFQECQNKARAVVNALAQAEGGLA